MGLFDSFFAFEVNATQVSAQKISAAEVGGSGGSGSVITASKIILGGWTLESESDGIYVTTPEGIKTKMELIDFRQTPVPPTAGLLLPSNRASVSYEAIPGGPQKTPGGQIGGGNAKGGGGAIGSAPGIPGVPFDAPSASKILPGVDGTGFSSLTSAAQSVLPPSMNNPDFIGGLNKLAEMKNVSANSLMTCMQISSGFTSVDLPGVGSNAVNALTQATGLAQITPDTAKLLGYTTDQIKNMNPTQQLLGPITSQFQHMTFPQLPSTTDLYMANFFPGGIGKPNNFVLGNLQGMGPQAIANANPAFVGSGGVVTVGSVKNWIASKYPAVA